MTLVLQSAFLRPLTLGLKAGMGKLVISEIDKAVSRGVTRGPGRRSAQCRKQQRSRAMRLYY